MATPLKLAATVTLDASQVPAGAQATKQAIAGIGTEAAATTAKLQKLIDAELGIARPAANSNSRATEIAAYGAELDRLQAKFDPLFAAQLKYRNALQQIDQAQRLGVISASQAIDLRLKETSAYNALASSANNAAAANKRYAEAAVARVTITPDRGADIAAYGAELDRLQAKFDPLFAAQQRYENTLQQISQAQQVGAISASQAIDLKLKETNAYNALTSAADNAAVANKRYAEAAVAKVTVTPDRGADIAAYGAELDRLRAKYNPLYAVTVSYKTAVSEIREAQKAGAISSDEMTAAITRQRQATLASIDAIKGRNTALRGSGAGNSFAATNLTYQAQDVITQAAMGGVPSWMIGLQQGPQAAMSFQGQSPKQALSTVAGGLAGLVAPMSLITVGLVTATAAAVQFGASLLGSLNTTEAALEKHEAAMQRIKATYDGAAKSGEQYGRRAQAAITYEADQDRIAQEKALETSLKTAAYRTTPIVDASQYSYPGADVAGIQAQAMQDTYGQLAGAVATFSEAARVGKGDVLEFNAQIQEILAADPSNKFLQNATAKLLEYTKAATDAANRLKELNDQQREMTLMMSRSNAALAAQQYQGDNVRRRADGTRQYEAEAAGIGARSPAELAAAERRRLEAQPVDVKEDPQTRALRIQQSVDLAYQRANQSLVEAQRDRQLSIDQTIEAQRRELALIGNKTAASEAEKFAAEQIAAVKLAAARQNVPADENEIRLIREKAAEYGRLQQQIAAANVLHEQSLANDRLGYQVGIAGRSQTEQAALLAQYDAEVKIREQGISAASAEASAIRRGAAAQAEMNAQLSRSAEAWGEIRKSSEGAIDGIVDGLSSGDISKSLESVSKDIQKTVLDLAVKNPLKNALTGSNYGTLADVGGVKGVASNLLGDNKSVGSMAVTAGTVMINGGVAGTGLGAAGLQAANSNSASTLSASALTGLGQSMSTAGNYKGAGVDPRLTDILNTAAERTPGFKVDAISGFRAGDPRFHGKGLATDVQLTDLATGKQLGNYQDASSFSAYEKYAQTARAVQMEKYPELANQFRWGGYFSGDKGKYGALDTMHFDLGGNKVGMGGGSWDKGLSSAQASLWPGIQSSSTKATQALDQLATGSSGATQNLGVFGSGLSQLGNGLTNLLTGNSSGLTSILSSLTSSSFKPTTTLGSFLTTGFDGGGYTGAGGRKEPAGVVHKGEVVWSQDDVARAGGAHVVDAMRLGYRGYDKGGVVGGSAASGASSNDNGGGNIVINNYSSANVQAEQTTDDKGRRQTKFVISDTVGDAIGTKGGRAGKTVEQQYGLRRKGISR